MSPPDPIDALLAPRVVVVVGASDDVTRIGGRPIAAMRRAGFAGRILPVNPKRDTVQGLPCHATVADLPERPDAALIAVPAKLVPDVIRDLGAAGCAAATMFAAGFAEMGAAGMRAQADLVALARRHGVRLLGPNTLGVYNVGTGYYGTFSSSLDTGLPLPGNIGIASQSGAFGAHLGAVARDRGLGVSVLVTTGNEADITVADAIMWMARDPGTEVICAYMEAVNDAPAFLAALEAARAVGKPVVALKAGRSTLGARAAASHTASLAGDAAVADAVLRERGVFVVTEAERLMDFAYALSHGTRPASRSLGIVTVSGGAGIVAADEAERVGLPMPPMPEAAQARLRAILPYAAPGNPLDCTAQALNDPTLLHSFTKAALEDGGYGAVLCFLTYVGGSPTLIDRIVEALAPLRAAHLDRILAVCAIGAPDILSRYGEHGILVFGDPCRAVRALDAAMRTGRGGAPTACPDVPPVELPDHAPDEAEAKAILAGAGIDAAPERAVADADGAVRAAESLGYPVAMKVLSPDILHKSEIGGVRLDLRDAAAVREAHDAIAAAVARNAPEVRVTGTLVARHLTGGVECFMGVNRDPTFGPVAAFGLGGVFVEILDDVALRLCPFDEAAARETILSVRGAAVLRGARGRAPADLDALARTLSRLSIFAAGAGPRLRSVDLNPVLAMSAGKGAFALDAVIELNPTHGG